MEKLIKKYQSEIRELVASVEENYVQNNCEVLDAMDMEIETLRRVVDDLKNLRKN